MATATSSVARTPAPGSVSVATAGRPQLKGSISGSPSNNNRRATQSPMDGPQRRSSSHKGWPVQQQQKYSGSGVPTSSSPTPNQAAAAMKSRTPSTAPGGESDTHDKHMHDRLLFLLTKLMAGEVVVTVKSGAQYIGILLGADPRNHDLGISLKQVKLLKPAPGDDDEKTKESEYLGGGKEKVMIFEPKDVVEITAQKVYFETGPSSAGTQQNGISGGFKTDSDISGNTAHRERELHRWQPDESPYANTGLEDTSSGPGQGWNQFEANERLFGVKSDFDENIYTTKLNRDHPEYKSRAAAAERIAAEIEGQSTSGLSAHVAEERGVVTPDDSGMDEEDKYSGVQRTAPAQVSTNRYTPPARRAPTGQPTVPGAPHDPAIIASQLVRPETLQQKKQQPQVTSQSQQSIPKTSEDAIAKAKERPGLPDIITPIRSLPAGNVNHGKQGEAPAIERDLSNNFKNFVKDERERVQKRKALMAHRDRESKLRELKKFSESFTLKTAVPQDLVPILTKDKAKQAEILEKTKQQSLAKLGGGSNKSTPSAPSSAQPTTSGSQAAVSQSGKVPPPNSFAARDPERFKREMSALLQNFPKFVPPQQAISQNIRRVQADKNLPVRSPIPVPEQQRPQYPPTGPSASNTTSSKRLNVNARPFEFKPNPSAAAFTPTFGGHSTNATPSPTASAPPNIASRAASPSLFFGNKRLKTEKERLSIKGHFNPFDRMKKTKAGATQTGPGPGPAKLYGNANDYIDKPWYTPPTWPTEDANKDKSYKTMFAAKTDFDPNSVHAAQPPHMMPPQPHHQQIPTHIPHMSHPPHAPHQPHHGPMQQHLIPPHYEQDAHLRQMSTPSSVMPSPSLHNATVAPYQQSPVPHPSQIAMYPNQQGAMQYPGPPGGPQYGFYNGFRATSGNPMMMHGPQPVPYPAAGQVGNQFVHPQMYSPQQPQAYLNNGPPPPNSQGYPSPGRPTPMMIHQGSSQGTPGGAQMMPYGMQPGQGGPIYGTQGQQQQMGMMRGQPPPPPHQGGPPPPQYYHGPQGHYPPGNRGNYAGPQPGMHAMPPPPQQQIVPPPPPQQPQQQQQQQQQQQPTAEAGEDGK